MDVFGRQFAGVGAALVETLVAISNRERRALIEAYSSDGSDLKAILANLGFRPREMAARVVAYENPKVHKRTLFNSEMRWAFNHFELIV